jgi:hypothetical protein
MCNHCDSCSHLSEDCGVRIEQRHTNKRIKKLEDSRLYRFYCGCVGFLPQTPTITNCFVVKDCRDGEFVFRFTPVLTKEPPKPLELEGKGFVTSIRRAICQNTKILIRCSCCSQPDHRGVDCPKPRNEGTGRRTQKTTTRS